MSGLHARVCSGGVEDLSIIGRLGGSSRQAIRVAVTWAMIHVPVLSKWLGRSEPSSGQRRVQSLWRVSDSAHDHHMDSGGSVIK